MTERTERGFVIFDRIQTANKCTLRVQESSRPGIGALVWLLSDGVEMVHTGMPEPIDPCLTVAQAKRLVAALQAFINAAESGQLAEPAEVIP